MLIPENFIAPVPNYYLPITDRIVPGICPFYFISTWGLVYNGSTHHFLPQNLNYDKNKYITISVSLKDGTNKYVQPHRLVLQTFADVPNSDKLDVNHFDGYKYHNWIWNLGWMTHDENIKYAVEEQQFTYGEDRGNSKLTNQQAEVICELIDKGLSNKQILNLIDFGKDLKMGKIITNIRCGLSWKSISRKYNFGSSY